MSTEARSVRTAPDTVGGRLKVVGPGLIIAATGVGAGDLVSSIVAGQRYGTALLWAIVIGVVLKYSLTEGIGRWYVASGTTILEGWYSLGRFVRGYFLVYLFVLAVVFGAAVTSACGLAMSAMVGLLPVWGWAIVHALAGLAIVSIGRYDVFETVMKVFAGVVFVTVIALAVLLTPDLGEIAQGFVPSLPDGSLLFALGLMGGIGATLTLASYTYWIREKGWRDPSWKPMIRLDCKVGYAATGIFAVAMLIVGAAFLFGSNASIEDEEGLVALSDPLGERFGEVARWLFLIGFWATAFDSVIGSWNGFAYLFADYVRVARGGGERTGGGVVGEEPALPAVPALDHLPADAAAVPRPAGADRDHLRRARRGVPALPGRHAPVAAELAAGGPRAPQRALLQRRDGRRGGAVRGARRAGDRGRAVSLPVLRPDAGGRSTVYGLGGAVACEHPHAAVAGIRALDAGGTAADACVAMGAAMAVLSPMMTGLGGDALALCFDAATGAGRGARRLGPRRA